MNTKESLIKWVVADMEKDMDGEKLRKLQIILTMRLDHFELTKPSRELVLYDETSDVAAYRQFVVSKKIQGLSDGTLNLYMQTINLFMRTLRKPYKDITTNDIRLFIANREMTDKVSKGTLSRERGCIVRFFHWLYIEEYISRDPGARVEKIQVPKRRKKEFSEFEVEKLRSAASNSKEVLIIELLLSTGCRVSELVSLTLDRYDQESGSISVIGKGNKERLLYLNAKAKLALEKYLVDVPHASGPAFYGRTKGSAMTVAGVQKLVKRIGDRARVTNVHPHRFRRTAATLARRHGMPLELVRDFLGHENVNTTLLYSMTSDSELKQSHQKYVN